MESTAALSDNPVWMQLPLNCQKVLPQLEQRFRCSPGVVLGLSMMPM